jgi:hypothetical protein
MNLQSLTREELYNLVWEKPMSILAPTFSISDVALKKRCKRLGIPTPTRGYWAKVEVGKNPKKAELTDIIPAPVRQQRQLESMVYFEVYGADYSLNRPHQFVVATKQALRGTRADSKGLVSTYGDSVWIEVSPESIPRALWILEKLLSHLKLNEVVLELRDGYKGGLHATLNDVDVHIQIREAVREFPNPDYKPSREFRSFFDCPAKKIYRCSGRLKIQAKMEYGFNREWIDRPTSPLDSYIADVAAGIVSFITEEVERKVRRHEQHKLIRALVKGRNVQFLGDQVAEHEWSVQLAEALDNAFLYRLLSGLPLNLLFAINAERVGTM